MSDNDEATIFLNDEKDDIQILFVKKEAEKSMNDYSDLAIGQLVWVDILLEGDKVAKYGQLGRVAGEITRIDLINHNAECKFLWVSIGDGRLSYFINMVGVRISAGQLFRVNIKLLEKHIAKTTGKIWWKLKGQQVK